MDGSQTRIAGNEMIAVRQLTKRFGTADSPVVALSDIDFSVNEGELVVVVGPSGCGKSTLLRILAGLLPPTSGEISFEGHHQPRIGFVFQQANLMPWRSVLNNALLPVDIQRLGRDKLRAKAMELLKLVGLEGFEHRFPWELSGGMQQRVALVRALIHDPALLLMDEPFGALDAMTRELMNQELQRIWMERRKTVLFITHSIGEAVYLADRVLVMTPRPGRIADELKIDLPRPRGLEVMNTPEFGAYVKRIRTGLNASGGIE